MEVTYLFSLHWDTGVRGELLPYEEVMKLDTGTLFRDFAARWTLENANHMQSLRNYIKSIRIRILQRTRGSLFC